VVRAKRYTAARRYADRTRRDLRDVYHDVGIRGWDEHDPDDFSDLDV
jgi:hypothetical protein